MLSSAEPELMYAQTSIRQTGLSTRTFGEMLLRSAAIVEQTAGGITARLWDDPFEWTLPEKLNTKDLISEYFDEVESIRNRAFGFFSSDADLSRSIPAPEDFRTLAEILISTAIKSGEQLASASELLRSALDLKEHFK